MEMVEDSCSLLFLHTAPCNFRPVTQKLQASRALDLPSVTFTYKQTKNIYFKCLYLLLIEITASKFFLRLNVNVHLGKHMSCTAFDVIPEQCMANTPINNILQTCMKLKSLIAL